MKINLKTFRPALISFAIMTILCGVIYPGIVTAIAQTLFTNEADGSIITVTQIDGTQKEYGSLLIAQEFTKPEYLVGRPMGVTNLSTVSEEQKKLVQERIDWWHSFEPENKKDIPIDLVTASGSGVDPNISPEAAEYQVPRIARERGISEDAVREVINKCSSKRFLGFWGEPAVNVLKVNLMLDGLLQSE